MLYIGRLYIGTYMVLISVCCTLSCTYIMFYTIILYVIQYHLPLDQVYLGCLSYHVTPRKGHVCVGKFGVKYSKHYTEYVCIRVMGE